MDHGLVVLADVFKKASMEIRPIPEHPQDFLANVQMHYMEDNGATPPTDTQCNIEYMETSCDDNNVTFTAYFDLEKTKERLIRFDNDKYGVEIHIYSNNNNPRIKKLFLWESRAIDQKRLKKIITDYPKTIKIPGRIGKLPFVDKYQFDLELQMKKVRLLGYMAESLSLTIPISVYEKWLDVRVKK